MPEDNDYENESPFGENENLEEHNLEQSFPEDETVKQEKECPYCRGLLVSGADGSYQHETGLCQAFFESEEELAAAEEKITQKQKREQEKQEAEAEERNNQIEQEKQEILGQYYDQIRNAVAETIQIEIQNSLGVLQRAAEDLENAKEGMLIATTDVTRSSISEKISHYQSKIAETNDADPKVPIYKDLENQYNNFLIAYDDLEKKKKSVLHKISELSSVEFPEANTGLLEEYQNLLSSVEKLYFRK